MRLHLDHRHLKSCNVIGQQQGSENSWVVGLVAIATVELEVVQW